MLKQNGEDTNRKQMTQLFETADGVSTLSGVVGTVSTHEMKYVTENMVSEHYSMLVKFHTSAMPSI